jgi:UDP-glucose 4-epimerase
MAITSAFQADDVGSIPITRSIKNMKKKILITGGLGFIGSHTTVVALEAGHEVVILDDLSNSDISVLDNIAKITGKMPVFYNGKIQNKELLNKIFNIEKIDSVIHFAAYKSVNESVRYPLKYYNNNVVGSLLLIETMLEHGVNEFVFSSSATVYRSDQVLPYYEEMELGSRHAYGNSKIITETILQTLFPILKSIALRYFNPVGAHISALLGENSKGEPTNLFPIINQVAIGNKKKLLVYGNDYNTEDGTPERDYIHVMDVAEAHLSALAKIGLFDGFETFNIGTGKSSSVLDIIKLYESINDIKINYELADRREGDVPTSVANVEKAKQRLGFETRFSIDEMVRDSFRFMIKKESKE